MAKARVFIDAIGYKYAHKRTTSSEDREAVDRGQNSHDVQGVLCPMHMLIERIRLINYPSDWLSSDVRSADEHFQKTSTRRSFLGIKANAQPNAQPIDELTERDDHKVLEVGVHKASLLPVSPPFDHVANLSVSTFAPPTANVPTVLCFLSHAHRYGFGPTNEHYTT
ncbi:unnamed protein product [Rhizoctonia solani]|uniref:Uncharacterized protein n=1 Tax=Rhizoctonia solani TaxID=456999 RepID=A0A8H3HF49_9AGAM|nr:unnamed protein product [Rhizoctonia solani]